MIAIMYDTAIRDAIAISKKNLYQDLPLYGFVLSVKDNLIF